MPVSTAANAEAVRQSRGAELTCGLLGALGHPKAEHPEKLKRLAEIVPAGTAAQISDFHQAGRELAPKFGEKFRLEAGTLLVMLSDSAVPSRGLIARLDRFTASLAQHPQTDKEGLAALKKLLPAINLDTASAPAKASAADTAAISSAPGPRSRAGTPHRPQTATAAAAPEISAKPGAPLPSSGKFVGEREAKYGPVLAKFADLICAGLTEEQRNARAVEVLRTSAPTSGNEKTYDYQMGGALSKQPAAGVCMAVGEICRRIMAGALTDEMLGKEAERIRALIKESDRKLYGK